MFSKGKVIAWLLGSLVILFLFPKIARAQVVINEFSSFSAYDWVEIYNISTESADLSLYKLKDKYGNEKPLSGIIAPYPNGFSSVDWYNKLDKTGDVVNLIRVSDGFLIDSVSYGLEGGVCAPEDGESVGRYPDANQTIERFSTSSRNVSNNDTPRDPCPTPTPEATATPTPTNSPTATPTKTPTPTPSTTLRASPTPTHSTTSTPLSTSPLRASSAPTAIPENLVLGLRNELASADSSPVASVAGTTRKFPVFPVILIFSGVLCIGGAIFAFFKNAKAS